MCEKKPESVAARRQFLARLGAGAGLVGATAIGASPAAAQSVDASWRPAHHPQDDWLDAIPGRHRLVVDATSGAGMGSALQFAINFFLANEDGYGLADHDLAVVVVARHFATPFAFNDGMWSKYGKQFAAFAAWKNPKGKKLDAGNAYNAPGDGRIADAVRRGVQFAVCAMAARAAAGMIVGPTGDTSKVYAEFAANLIPNSRMVPAGILAVNRAQERGYTLATAG